MYSTTRRCDSISGARAQWLYIASTTKRSLPPSNVARFQVGILPPLPINPRYTCVAIIKSQKRHQADPPFCNEILRQPTFIRKRLWGSRFSKRSDAAFSLFVLVLQLLQRTWYCSILMNLFHTPTCSTLRGVDLCLHMPWGWQYIISENWWHACSTRGNTRECTGISRVWLSEYPSKLYSLTRACQPKKELHVDAK